MNRADLFSALAPYVPALRSLAHYCGIALACFVAYRVFRLAMRHVIRVASANADERTRVQREQRLRTLGAILENLARFLIFTFAGLMILGEFGLDITPLIAGASFIGVAVGFGAQSLVKDFFSGFFVVLENQFSIGDTVTVAGLTGAVEQMTLRVTVLRDLEGNVHYVPNGKIETVTVVGREWARALVDITVPYREDVSRAIDVALAAARSYAADSPDVVVGEPEALGVQELGPRGVSLRFAARTPPGRNLAVAREIRRRIKVAFDEAGIRFAQQSDDDSHPVSK